MQISYVCVEIKTSDHLSLGDYLIEFIPVVFSAIRQNVLQSVLNEELQLNSTHFKTQWEQLMLQYNLFNLVKWFQRSCKAVDKSTAVNNFEEYTLKIVEVVWHPLFVTRPEPLIFHELCMDYLIKEYYEFAAP